jgi:magnesium transporter
VITAYVPVAGGLAAASLEAAGPSALWIDLVSPDAHEVAKVEAFAGIHLPSLQDMTEIEASSRLVRRPGYQLVTVPVLTGSGSFNPRATAMSFVLGNGRLITLRYDTPTAVETFIAGLGQSGETSAAGVLLGLLEAIVDRIADVLEHLGADLDAASHRIFHQPTRDHKRRRATSRELEGLLRSIGRAGDLSGRARETLLGVKRMGAFLAHGEALAGEALRLDTIGHDVQSLAEHIDFMSNKINFLLDATVGVIGIQQNQVIKMFTIMSVLFLPPTLVASWYGMNFKIIPELQWEWGYAYAIALAVISAIVPYWLFKRKGWM